jgi:hypothetical protein
LPFPKHRSFTKLVVSKPNNKNSLMLAKHVIGFYKNKYMYVESIFNGGFFNIKACFDVSRKTYTFSTYLSTLKRQETSNPCFSVFSL